MWLATLAGTIIYLDTSVIGQTLLGQPIVACVLYGILVDRPEVGLFFGVLFELLWLANLQIGAAKFAEGNVGAIIATATAASVAPSEVTGEPAWIVLLLCTALGLIFAHVGRELAPIVRRTMNGISARFVESYTAGKSGGREILAALGVHVLAGASLTLLGVTVGHFVLRLYFGQFYPLGPGESIVTSTDPLCSGMWPGLLGACAAASLLQLVSRRDWIWSLVVGGLLGWVLL
ncbi:MAG: PTS sugar transporter subunit IIC [Calditrichaeota bacterium]|nr:PTS sugar transporter subunit IIC [Calditrichota bacterium]MCB9368748.1 PTS sugar transporter subunit IIC [Calditrichota bacterium]